LLAQSSSHESASIPCFKTLRSGHAYFYSRHCLLVRLSLSSRLLVGTRPLAGAYFKDRSRLDCLAEYLLQVSLQAFCWCLFFASLMERILTWVTFAVEIVPGYQKGSSVDSLDYRVAKLRYKVNEAIRMSCLSLLKEWYLLLGLNLNERCHDSLAAYKSSGKSVIACLLWLLDLAESVQEWLFAMISPIRVLGTLI